MSKEPDPNICPACGEPIGDYAFEVNGEMVCEDCFRAEIDDLTPRQLAERLGLRVEYRG